MALSKEVGLDSTLGARKNALIAPVPNTREQQERTQQVVWEHATSRPDYVDLMCTLFAPPRPVTPVGTCAHHPEDCGCTSCRHRRGKRAQAAKRGAPMTGAEKRAAARARAAADPSLIPHGTSSGYVYWGCRCIPCTAAQTAVSLKSRRKRKEAADAA